MKKLNVSIPTWITIIIKKFAFALSILVILSVIWVVAYKWVNPPLSTLMLIRSWEKPYKAPLYNLQKKWVPLSQISPHLIRTIIIGEDPAFFSHKGYFLKALMHSFKEDLKGKHIHGSSTITQQTAKNVFLYPTRSYLRKALEFYFSLLMEKLWDKERILEVYLNVIEFGSGIYGVQNAAEKFFSKPASDICFDEACLMSAILTNPRALNPLNPNNYVIYRASYMFNKGYRVAKKETSAPFLSGKEPCFPVL